MPRPSLRGKKFEELSLKHQRAVRMALEGRGTEEIAREVGNTQATVWSWFHEPDGSFVPIVQEMKREQAEKSKAQFASFQEKMTADAKYVWEKMLAMIDAEDTPKHIQGQLIDSVLDRAGMPRNQRSEQTTEFKGISKEDRDGMYADVLRLVKGKKAVNE